DLYEQGFGAMRTIASATAEGGRSMDRLTPLPAEVRDYLGQLAEGLEALGETVPASTINRPEADPVTRIMVGDFDTPDSSYLIMPLMIQNKWVGNVVLEARGKDRYSQAHADLLSLLSQPFAVAMSNALQHQEVLRLQEMLIDDNRYLHRELHHKSGDVIIGENFGLSGVMEMVRQVSSGNSPVLILGETGVGKDMIANAIHYSSNRREGPLITVNCGGIPDTLIDSELFGHEKGAFTGALAQKRGRFERADRGTVFLDEIGELPPPAQVRLLRVLQNKEIERVGGIKAIPVDIRIIAATHRNLREMVRTKEFREDLWFRLNVFPITIPPLRDRTADIPALLRHFLDVKSRELNLAAVPEITPGAIDRLMAYSWPGNVRELENVVERALILSRDGRLKFGNLGEEPVEKKTTQPPDSSTELSSLDETVKNHILKALTAAKGKIHGKGGAADLIGINPNTLRSKMRKLGILPL
ncbi:MAG: sigma-54-dependent Fis family transcriptional regulator, partial [Proteobacteria bacterium]|nr:sigma-54-dependent Fis family transcriptional regulator [Pseudomonadota bacterium]